MYTFLINEDNSLTASVIERIMERSKLVDSLHFLADTTYKNVDMTDYEVRLEYVLPVSKRYRSELLIKSDELYKNKLEYVLPFDTTLTSEPGDIEIQLTFTNVVMTADGDTVQYVRKVGPGVIHIVAIKNWSELIPDSALDVVDQRILKLSAAMKELEAQATAIIDTKADSMIYQDDKLQLTSNGVPIGAAIDFANGKPTDEDGNIKVIEF